MANAKKTPEDKRHDLIIQLTHTSENGKTAILSDTSLLQVLQDVMSKISDYVGPKMIEQKLLGLLQDTEGYFADEFTPEEFDRMRYNIASDFPIFLETCVGNLQAQVKDLKSQRETMRASEFIAMYAGIEQRNTMIDTQQEEIKGMNERFRVILRNLVSVEISSDNCINGALGQFSRDAIIMEKLNQGIALNAEELQIVKSKITNY